MRVPVGLYERLEALADESNETVSHCARRLLSKGLEAPDRDAIDDAISALLLVRRQLSQHSDAERHDVPIGSRTVDVLDAKRDLQDLLDDVECGVEIIITHAGAESIRLVQIAARRRPETPTLNR